MRLAVGLMTVATLLLTVAIWGELGPWALPVVGVGVAAGWLCRGG